MREAIGNCYLDDPLGVRLSPRASGLIPPEREMASLLNYHLTRYQPSSHIDNHFYFARLGAEDAGFCALILTREMMYCPLGGVVPRHARRGVFHDILRFSRCHALANDIPMIHMGIRGHNQVSLNVFLDHAYRDTGHVTRDYLDYLFYLFPRG